MYIIYSRTEQDLRNRLQNWVSDKQQQITNKDAVSNLTRNIGLSLKLSVTRQDTSNHILLKRLLFRPPPAIHHTLAIFVGLHLPHSVSATGDDSRQVSKWKGVGEVNR